MESINEVVKIPVIKKLTVLFITVYLTNYLMAAEIQPLFFPENLAIQSGDLIFREGTQPVSDIVLNIDQSGYSHVGMLYKNNNIWYVIHATPSEVKGKPDSVVLDDLTFYLAKQNAKKFAIYQVQASKEQHQQATIYAIKQLGIPFDITAKNGTYCTLLMLDAWKIANIDFNVSFTQINMPLVGGYYLLPKELRASEKLKEIYKSNIN